jgi:hypothetical protein
MRATCQANLKILDLITLMKINQTEITTRVDSSTLMLRRVMRKVGGKNLEITSLPFDDVGLLENHNEGACPQEK